MVCATYAVDKVVSALLQVSLFSVLFQADRRNSYADQQGLSPGFIWKTGERISIGGRERGAFIWCANN